MGAMLMLAAMPIIPVMDATAKFLSDSYHTVQLVWARYFFHLLLFLPFVLWRYRSRLFRPSRPGLQLLRGTMLMTSTGLFFAAIALMPLADTLAVVFIYPFVITALSPFVLDERVGPRRWMAVTTGFVGALIIIRPGAGILSAGVPFAVAAGAVYACYALSTRKLAGTDPPLVTLTFTGLVGAAVTTLALPFVWVTPQLADWPLMLLLGLCAATGHLCFIIAHEKATASQLAPLGYSEIVSATLLGYAVFGDFPDSLTWLGIAVIVASGVYISLREGKRRA
jgi:drug/metabolite transporter (DMT)-like permease